MMKFSEVKGWKIPEGTLKRVRKKDSDLLWGDPNYERYYVSLGDSIAAGHTINADWDKNYGERSQYGVNGNTSTAIVPQSYTDLIRTDLYNTYDAGDVKVTSYARSGDTVADLMEKLNHAEVQRELSKAKIVTICIGANNVLQPAFSHLDEYITTGSLASAEAVIENNFAALADDNDANSYTALFNKLSELNPNAKYVFTTVYNPYKYLYIEEGQNGFFKPVLDTIPEMVIDVDGTVEDMFLGGNNWLPDTNIGLGSIIKDGILSTPIFVQLFSRMNGVGGWAENYVTRLNTLLRDKINAYKAVNPNFYVAESKALFDTYPDRTVSADVHYNDLVNVEYTRGYDTMQMDWGRLYGNGDAAAYWTNLAWKYINWSNAFPSMNVLDYVSFDMNGFADELVDQIVNKVIIPDVDPHPEEGGHRVLKQAFSAVLN